MNRSDENAVRKSIEGLGPNPSARQILDAITNTKTYSPEAKQNVLSNYFGVEKFEELKRHALESEKLEAERNKIQEETTNLKRQLEETEKTRKQQIEANDALSLIDFSNLGQEEKELLRNKVRNNEISLSAIKEIIKPNKSKEKMFETEEAKNTAQKAYNRLAELIPDVGASGAITSNLGGKTAQSYGEFTSLTGALESFLVEMVNRGTLSNTRFKYITETLLPKPSDSQATIKGKLQGLATVLDLDESILEGKKKERQEVPDSKGRPSLTSFER